MAVARLLRTPPPGAVLAPDTATGRVYASSGESWRGSPPRAGPARSGVSLLPGRVGPLLASPAPPPAPDKHLGASSGSTPHPEGTDNVLPCPDSASAGR